MFATAHYQRWKNRHKPILRPQAYRVFEHPLIKKPTIRGFFYFRLYSHSHNDLIEIVYS
jgi:hypothetical protein